MIESPSQISIPQNQSEKVVASKYEQVSLPQICHKPSSRGNIQKNLIQRGKKMTLPTIKGEMSDNQNRVQQNIKEKVQKRQKSNENKDSSPIRNKFAKDVEQKLKLVLGGMDKKQLDQGDSFDSDDFDFEAKVNANKKLIKMHRIKRQNEKIPVQTINKDKVIASKPKKYYSKNQNLYDKRARQYRQQGSQNKYLQKKKQTINNNKSLSPVQESLKQIKSRDYISLKKDIKYQSPKKLNPRAKSHKNSKKNIQEVNKSLNLFDSIQNYLQNPSSSIEKQKDKPLIGLSLLKAKRDLQDKIRAINQKLKKKQQQDNGGQNGDSTFISMVQLQGKYVESKIPQKTVKQWRKFEIKEKNINLLESNFDRELERINDLQEKTSDSLVKYLEHKKILVELEQRRKEFRHSNTQ